ncbi:MAG: cupin domain-containing protein [Salinivirgaceae bacterium]|nr:cupin domain-containing protein [Salinivirgaceae bacterium]
MESGEYWIEKLKLEAHPEGGYFKRTYCSNIEMQVSENKRYSASMIYYLLNKSDKSHFHRLKSDEIWIYQKGSPIEIFIIDEQVDIPMIPCQLFR